VKDILESKLSHAPENTSLNRMADLTRKVLTVKKMALPKRTSVARPKETEEPLVLCWANKTVWKSL